MAEKPSKRRHSYLVKAILKTGEDFGATEIISEIVGGIVIAFLAYQRGIANQAELRALIFLCVGAAIIAPIFGFLMRLVFITPYKIYKDQESEIETLQTELEKQKATKANLEIIPKVVPNYEGQYVFICVHNIGPAFAKEVEVKLEKFLFKDSINETIASRIGRKGIKEDTPENAITDINAQSEDTWVLLSNNSVQLFTDLRLFIIPDIRIYERAVNLREFEFWVSANAQNAASKKEIYIKLRLNEAGKATLETKCL